MTKARILLADNDAKQLAVWSKVLSSAKYQVTASSDASEVQELARTEIFHLAVLDLHWEDDNDENDLSGLDIAHSVSRFTPCIFLTGSTNARSSVKALKHYRRSAAAVNLVMKQDGPKALLEAVEDAITPWIFVVHGHDGEAVLSVERFLDEIGTQPIVLRNFPGSGRTIIEKFEHYSSGSCFAVVLLTPDDMGGKNEDPLTLRPRARQNVIFELGFFFAKLGRSRVAILVKEGKQGLEPPSDNHGIEYIPMDSGKSWQLGLVREMEKAGIKVHLSPLRRP